MKNKCNGFIDPNGKVYILDHLNFHGAIIFKHFKKVKDFMSNRIIQRYNKAKRENLVDDESFCISVRNSLIKNGWVAFSFRCSIFYLENSNYSKKILYNFLLNNNLKNERPTLYFIPGDRQKDFISYGELIEYLEYFI